MEITEVKVTPINNVKKLKGFASIVFDNCFIVSDIKIIETTNSAFLSMPSKRSKNGKFRDVAHPLNMETRKMIEEKVFEAYEKATGEKIEGEATIEYNQSLENGETEVSASSLSNESKEDYEVSDITPSDVLSVKEFGY
jgi:stage V sporulation protein G